MWVIERGSGYVYFNNERVGQLGASEILIFQFLSDNLGMLKSKDALLDYAWPQKVVAPNSLTVAIKNLRKVFSARPSQIEIKTHHGKGYSLHGDIAGIDVVELLGDCVDEKIAPCELSSESSEPVIVSHKEPQAVSSINLIKWMVGAKRMMVISLCIMLGITLTFSTALLWTYNKPVYCEEIASNTVVCGISNLNEKDKARLKQHIEEQAAASQEERYARYVYGYSYSPKNLVFYPVM